MPRRFAWIALLTVAAAPVAAQTSRVDTARASVVPQPVAERDLMRLLAGLSDLGSIGLPGGLARLLVVYDLGPTEARPDARAGEHVYVVLRPFNAHATPLAYELPSVSGARLGDTSADAPKRRFVLQYRSDSALVLRRTVRVVRPDSIAVEDDIGPTSEGAGGHPLKRNS